MTPPNESPPASGDESRHRLVAWAQRHPRQALMIGFVTALLVFAIVRGFVSDNQLLVDQTDTAKARWELIQTAQESFFEANGRYAGSLDTLDGVEDALETPDETLDLSIDLERDGAEVAMTLTGRTIRLTRTLADGAEVNTSCLILTSRAGEC